MMQKPQRLIPAAALDSGFPAVCVVPAAGSGVRLGAGVPKPSRKIGGLPIAVRTLRMLLRSWKFEEVFMPVEPTRIAATQRLLSRHGLSGVRVIAGGRTRSESVRNAFGQVRPGKKVVLIHDVARPFLDSRHVREVLRMARKKRAALLAQRSTATVKQTSGAAPVVLRTLDRRCIYLAQTPQAFSYRLLQAGYAKNDWRPERFTDEAGMAEAAGFKVWLVEGPSSNIKITTPADLCLAKALLKAGANALK
ncbi:MAG: 2-C-methyl-D-erythritol 4-phosphate cytidylyltransferase [Candidatus Omnitrophica bacterium]|nr:2-C-methyl-D-erythritol 4-phosphate cytidylyltransferase [Candidatus Omnitrophota bacterium]